VPSAQSIASLRALRWLTIAATPCTLYSVPAAPGSDRPIMKLGPGAPHGGGWGWCLLLQDIGVTRQAFQYDPRAQLSPTSQASRL
jgi:hypothetical protein